MVSAVGHAVFLCGVGVWVVAGSARRMLIRFAYRRRLGL